MKTFLALSPCGRGLGEGAHVGMVENAKSIDYAA
jgi:hypothetical protein